MTGTYQGSNMVSAPFAHSSSSTSEVKPASEDATAEKLSRPARQYRIFTKPGSKWEQLAPGGQEVIVLPLNPAGMPVEAFVEHLAVAVGESIDSAIAPTR
jgi:hypothetical protein